jgi:hypothetical protein
MPRKTFVAAFTTVLAAAGRLVVVAAVVAGAAGVVVLAGATLTGCGTTGPATTTVSLLATDPYEPNNDLDTATELVPGTALQAFIKRGGQTGDRDIFRCPMPAGGPGSSGGFRVELQSDTPDALEMQVAISLPDAFEAISWPGWTTQRDGNLLYVDATATGGTLLIFVSGVGPGRVDYSIKVVAQ